MAKQNTINDLHFDDKNFNKGTQYGKSLMEKSLSKFGAGRSILIDKNNRIIAGNKTTENFAEIGLENVQIVETDGKTLIAVRRNDIDLDTPEGREFALADNQTAKVNIDFDFGSLEAELEADVIEEWGIEIPDEEVLEAEEDDFEIPDEIQTDIVLGDLFEIGEHRLLCGDSTDSEQVAKLMNGGKADMVFTDPDFSMNDNDLFACYSNEKIINPSVSFWVCGDKQAIKLAMNDFERFTHFFIHDFKVATLVSNTQPMQRHNLICKFGNKKMTNLSDGFTTIVPIATERTLKNHKETPMAKRVGLPAAFIEHYAESNGIIVDIFLHSGSTMVAAHQLKRKCYGMELDCGYADVIVKRMLKLDKTLKIKKNGIDETEKWLKLIE